MKKNTTISGKGSAVAGRGVLLGVMLAMALLLPCIYQALHAQRFDWVKLFDTYNYDYDMRCALADHDGNLYFLGYFDDYGGTWDHELLFTYDLHGTPREGGAILAKISPDGKMVWKKMWVGGVPAIYDMRIVGDSSVVVLLRTDLPTDVNGSGIQGSTYYIDTLLPYDSYNYPFPEDSLTYRMGLLYAAFDFDGNLIEKHLLNVYHADTNGVPYTHDGRYVNEGFSRYHSFDLDKDGNIYWARVIEEAEVVQCDTCPDGLRAIYLDGGEIGYFCFYIDDRTVAKLPITEPVKMFNTQLLKFSPHFEKLLSSRYVCDKIEIDQDLPVALEFATVALRVVDTDVYVRLNTDRYCDKTILFFDTAQGVKYAYDSTEGSIEFDRENAFLLGYDSSYHFKFMRTLDFHDRSTRFPIVVFSDLIISGDTLFVLFNTAAWFDGGATDTSFSYQDYMFSGKHTMALAIDRHTQDLLAVYAVDGPGEVGGAYNLLRRNYMDINNDYMVCAVSFLGGNPNMGADTAGQYNEYLGFCIFDRHGTPVRYVDYQIPVTDKRSRMGCVATTDSIIYTCTMIGNNSYAIYGDTLVWGWDGRYYVAKYVDSSLTAPYITLRAETVPPRAVPSVYPNPTAGKVTLDMEGEQLAEASLTAMSGVTVPVVCKGGAIDLSGCADGQYVLRVATTAGNVYTYKVIVKR